MTVRLSERQCDALREVANIGAGHAATALSMLTRHRVDITVPKVFVAPFDEVTQEVAAAGGRLVTVGMGLLGDLRGRCLFLLREREAHALSDYLLGREVGTAADLDEMEESALREAGNILGGAFTAALGEMTGMLYLLSVPDLAVHEEGEERDTVLGVDPAHQLALSVQTEFHVDALEDAPFGFFLVLTDTAGVEAILTALRVS
jgi:chemotaxis protein CheC